MGYRVYVGYAVPVAAGTGVVVGTIVGSIPRVDVGADGEVGVDEGCGAIDVARAPQPSPDSATSTNATGSTSLHRRSPNVLVME